MERLNPWFFEGQAEKILRCFERLEIPSRTWAGGDATHTAATGARGGCVRGVARVGLRRQHDRREAIMATTKGGIIQDDLLPTPE
jgi:hypothetical protein